MHSQLIGNKIACWIGIPLKSERKRMSVVIPYKVTLDRAFIAKVHRRLFRSSAHTRTHFLRLDGTIERLSLEMRTAIGKRALQRRI